jgi:hypothetical protein
MTSSEIPQSPNAVCPLLNGIQAPSVFLRVSDGKSFDLGARLKTKPTIIVFYRGGW